MTAASSVKDHHPHLSSLWPAGRTLIAVLFAVSGVMKLAFAGGVAQAIASKGLPFPEALAYVTGVFEIASAILLMSGRFLVPTAVLLAAYTVTAAFLFHNFWEAAGEAQQAQLFNFLKNVALVGAFLIIIAVNQARAAPASASSSSENDAKAEVLRAERRWVDIYKRNGADAFAGLLTRDFVYTSPTGEVVPRQTYLDNLRNRTVVMTSVQPSKEAIQIYGDTAIVTATWTVDEAYRGHPFKGLVRITRVWVRENGQWKAAAFQVTTQS